MSDVSRWTEMPIPKRTSMDKQQQQQNCLPAAAIGGIWIWWELRLVKGWVGLLLCGGNWGTNCWLLCVAAPAMIKVIRAPYY